jgi:hypothetical protein
MARPLMTKRILERALAGGRWLVDHQNQDGSWKGLADPKVDAFYKACWSLSEVGQSAAAHRTLDYIYNHLLTPEGEFLTGNSDAVLAMLGQIPYMNSYIITGSFRAGRYEIGTPAISFLLTKQSPDHGGFYTRLSRDGAKNMSDTMSSSSAGIACLTAGKIEAARRVADYLAHLISLQPEPHDLFFDTINEDGHLYVDVKDDGDAYLRVIDTRKPDQCWFAMGLPFTFLVLLGSATNESRYRNLAQWYFDFQQRCISPWDGWSSGKAGWGCAMLYRMTGEAGYRDIALRVAKFIMERQSTDGSWRSGMSKRSKLINADFDLTGECTLWLSLISANLLARDMGRIPIVFNKTRIPRPKRTQPLRRTIVRTIKTHYRIFREEGLKEYFLRSYHYRREQVSGWIKKKP